MASKLDEKYICDRFQGLIEGKSAATTTEISAELGVSYQCIHRIIKKHGLGRKDGGKAAQVAARVVEGEIPKGLAMCDKYGCNKEQWEELRAMDEDYKKTPLAQYHTFKNNFQNLNPDTQFDLPLWEWWSAWKESGMWGKHKRNPEGMWVMVQVDKQLPVNKDNVRIVPFGQYLKESRKTTPRKPKAEAVA